MRSFFRTWVLCALVLVLFSARSWAQTSGKTFHWLGDAGSDVTNGANWLEQPDPDTGAVPGPLDFVELRWGDRPPVALDYGSANATYERILFNHANHPDFPGIGTTINGTGTLTLTRTGGMTSVDVKSLESQGGHRVSTINANINSLGMIEARNGHDLVFNGSVSVTTVHAYMDDDGVTTSDVVFNGPVTHTGYGEAKFMTGTGTVRFNNQVTLDHTVSDSGFGIRNGMTLILGQGFSPIKFTPSGGGTGLDTVDMYNNSKVKLEGDFVIGSGTDLFSRFGGGQVNTNTLNLNGHSDAVEFLGTHPGATFVIDYGTTPGANSFMWETTHHHVGNYNFVNFEIGVDTLTLGNVGSTWWTALDTETDGGGSPDTEVDKSHMTINGIPYHAFNAGVTTPYWSLVDPDVSRSVQFFNVPAGPNGDYNHNGIVDAADYVVWRNTDGSPSGYNTWKANFGAGSGAGAGATLSSGTAPVPEPVSIVLIAVGLVGLGAVRRRL
jgi:hypothetical protein